MKTINITGVIGDWWDGITEQDIIRELDDYDGSGLEVIINSPGGFAYDGISIYNRLKEHNPVVKVTGLAASAASVIAMAGSEIHMLTGAEMMIHNAWGLSIGDYRDLEKDAAHLKRLNGSIADTYAKRMGDKEQALALMADETWFTSDEAKDMGFATHIETGDTEQPVNYEAALAAMGSKRTEWMDLGEAAEHKYSAAMSYAKNQLEKAKLSLHPFGRSK